MSGHSYRRCLWGYDPQSFQDSLKSIEIDQQQEREELARELNQLNQENERLQHQMESTGQVSTVSSPAIKELLKTLLDMHLGYTNKLYQVDQELIQHLKRKERKLLEEKSSQEKMKEKLMAGIHSIESLINEKDLHGGIEHEGRKSQN